MSTTETVSPRGRRLAVVTAITGTVFIAAGAFWLSFTALADLARRSGIDAGQEWAWPLIVDGIIVGDTGGTTFDVSLVRQGRIPRTRETWLGKPLSSHMTGMPSVPRAIHSLAPPWFGTSMQGSSTPWSMWQAP